MRRGLIALLLAFGWLFATPAQATPLVNGDTIQFSYTWGSVTRTYTDVTLVVTVTNDVTNKIGYGGEIIDTYRITVGNQVLEVTEKHGPRPYTFTISGSQVVTLQGIDNGYWAGHYGPIMSVSTSPLDPPIEPVTLSPTTESATTSDATTSPPAETQTQTTESPALSQSPPLVSESPIVPSPQPQPSPEPVSSPTPEPIQPEPTPEPTPLETPTVSYPTQSPEPEPTQSPITESGIATQSPPIVGPTPQAPITTQVPQIPIVEPAPIQSSEGPNEEPATTTAQVIEIPEEAFGESLSETIQATVTQAIGAVTEAVGQLVETFTTAGLDMTPEQREEAQDVVVSTVIASQVAAGIRRIK